MELKQVGDELLQAAKDYQMFTEVLKDVLSQKPALWNELRKAVKTDTATDRMWEGTPLGFQESETRLYLRALEKKMVALRAQIEIAQIESKV